MCGRKSTNSKPQSVGDVSVVPLTSVPRANFPARVELPAGVGGLKTASWAKCDQVTTLPKPHLAPIGDSIYVVHAFQKKSKAGIATPKTEIELVRRRLKQLRSEVKNAEKKTS